MHIVHKMEQVECVGKSRRCVGVLRGEAESRVAESVGDEGSEARVQIQFSSVS